MGKKMNCTLLKEYLDAEVYSDAVDKNNNLKRFICRLLLRYLKPNTKTVYLLRKMQYHYFAKGSVHRFMTLYLHNRLWSCAFCCISPLAEIGIGLRLPHPTGIIIGGASVIGKNATIYQNVTIGSQHKGDYKLSRQPRIGDNVVVFANAQILGDISVGDNSIIGASSLVISDVPANSVYAGNPARFIKTNEL